MERSSPARAESPSRQILSERLYEKKVLTPLPDTYANNRAIASSDYLALTEMNSNWANKKGVYMKKSWPGMEGYDRETVTWLGRSTF